MAKDTIFLTAEHAGVTHQTDAPVIAVKFMESGYFPIYTRATPESLNGLEVTPEIVESALAASIFGWHIPAARQAIEFFKKKALQENE